MGEGGCTAPPLRRGHLTPAGCRPRMEMLRPDPRAGEGEVSLAGDPGGCLLSCRPSSGLGRAASTPPALPILCGTAAAPGSSPQPPRLSHLPPSFPPEVLTCSGFPSPLLPPCSPRGGFGCEVWVLRGGQRCLLLSPAARRGQFLGQSPIPSTRLHRSVTLSPRGPNLAPGGASMGAPRSLPLGSPISDHSWGFWGGQNPPGGTWQRGQQCPDGPARLLRADAVAVQPAHRALPGAAGGGRAGGPDPARVSAPATPQGDRDIFEDGWHVLCPPCTP